MKYKYEYGLTTEFNHNKRCDRCNNELKHSKWNDKDIIFSTSSVSTQGFLCIRCATTPVKVTKNVKTTLEDVDRYLCKLLGDRN